MGADLPDVVLVVLDTARADRFGFDGYARPTTPTVDDLASGGLRATAMFANAPWTLPSHASLFTGLYPSQHGSQWQTGPKMRPGVKVTMAEWFRSLGYQTVCVTNNGLISERTTLARGFDRYVFRLDIERGVKRLARRMQKVATGGDSGGRIVNGWMRRHLGEVRKPMFLFVNYLECHWSYAPPPAFARRVGGPVYGFKEGWRYRSGIASRNGPWEAITTAGERDLGVLNTYYDGELANADDHVAQLVGVLGELGRFRDDGSTLFMVTSDHGEHLGEAGLADHHASLDDTLLRVPFVAWGPGIVPRYAREEPTELVDVLPSMARLFGRPLPVEYLEARRDDLFTDAARAPGEQYVLAEWKSWTERERARLAARNPSYDFTGLARDLVGVRDARFKLVGSGDGAEVLYDCETDPGETRDAAAEHPEALARLRARLDRAIGEWRKWDAPAAETTDEERREIEERLSELGYI